MWRAKPNMKPRHLETLADGSWLAELRPSGNAGRHAEPLIDPGDRLPDRRRAPQRPDLPAVHHDRSIPTTPPRSISPLAYAQRWEIESAFDELKTHQRGARTVLRSKSPDLVLQEIWGHLCCHYAIRTLMWEAADHAQRRPRPGQLRRRAPHRPPLHLRGARFFPLKPLTTAGATPSCCSAGASTQPGDAARTPGSSNASMPRWHVKRARHHDWPQPTGPPTATILDL